MSWEESLARYLESVGLLARAADAIVEPVGDGNLNRVRRVRASDGRTMVVKEARGFIEKFPEYPLTSERIVFERRYEETVRALVPEVVGVLPAVLHFDEERRILVMEDLGDAPRQDGELLEGRLDLGAIRSLGEFLGAVHTATAGRRSELAPQFRNEEMRALHGGQLLQLPDSRGMAELPSELRRLVETDLLRSTVHERIRSLRVRYDQVRESLVHGDVKAANVVLQRGRPRLLDAEFAHVGDPAFDLGTALGHTWLHLDAGTRRAGHTDAETALLAGYAATGGRARELCSPARRWAGIDMIQHVIGPMRLPIFPSADVAAGSLSRGIELLLG